MVTETWRALSLAEALEFGRTHEVVKTERVCIDEMEGESVHFSDGSILQLLYIDAVAWSPVTWEEGRIILRVLESE